MKTREQELEELVRQIAPAVRDVIWCALVWNDHNFTEADIREKAKRAAAALDLHRSGMGDVEAGNRWMARIDAALSRRDT